jgi:hypothetical protein
MSDRTSSLGGPRRTGALAVLAAVAVLASGCGVVHISFGSSPPKRDTYRADLAYARCMRTHGVPKFPDPSPSNGFNISGLPRGNSPAARANDACKHLLLVGSTGTGSAGNG